MIRKPTFTAIDYRPVRRHTPVEEQRNGRRIRSDASTARGYRDTGCELSPSCLRCPLERCQFEETGGTRAYRRAPREAELRRRRAEGAEILALASEFGVSRRTVFRMLARTQQSIRPKG